MKVLLAILDNDSHLAQPPHGIAYLAAAARQAGQHEVHVWDAAVGHMPPEDLTRTIDELAPGVVGLGVIGGYWQHRQALLLGKAVAAAKRRPVFVLGGHGPASDPAYWTQACGADTVFVGEAETDFAAWLAAPRAGVFRCGAQDVDTLPWPAWDLFDMSVYRRTPYPRKRPSAFSATVLSGRGCPHSCSFCYRLEPGFRPRAPKAIAAEVEWLKAEHRVSYVNFDDELLTASAPRTLAVCEAIGPCGVDWMCNARVNVLAGERGEEVLRAMREAGAVFANLGIESLDDAVLRAMNKRQTAAQSIRAVERCLVAGVSPGLNVMWGSRGDSLTSLEELVRFLITYDDGAQLRTIRPPTPYPGSPDFADCVVEGVFHGSAEFYALHRNSDLATVQRTGLPDAEFHAALADANRRLVENYHQRTSARQCAELDALYAGENPNHRGLRQT